jgi:CRP/FNR family transcriptional regulator, cyclic AMP receptor protein
MLEPAQTVAIFQQQPEPVKFSAGEVIFEEGQSGEFMYGVIEGEVELIVNNQVVETIHRGDIFGEGALVQTEGNRASTAIAKTDCLLATLNKQRFLFAVEQTPMFALEVMKSYSDRLRRIKHSL